MRRTLTALTLATTALLALTGCVKYEADLTVHADQTVDGSLTVAVAKDALNAMGQSADDVFSVDGEQQVPLEGAVATDFEDDTFVGKTYSFDGATFEEFVGEDGHALTFNHNADKRTVEFAGEVTFAEDETHAAMFSNADIRVEITFPGEVIDSNGTVNGTTVTWEGDAADLDMHATAEDGRPQTPWLYIYGAAAALAAVAAGVLTVRRRRRRSSQVALDAPADAEL